MLVEKFFMLSPPRIHGSCHDSRKIAGQIAFEEGEVLISLRKTGAPGAIPTRDLPLRSRFTNLLFSAV